MKNFESIGVDALVIRDNEECYYERFFGELYVAILNGDASGDIKHSRVENSNIAVMRRLGMVVCLCAPEEFK